MPQLSYSIVADGGTDRALQPLIEWAIHALDPTVDILEPDFLKRRGGVAEFLEQYETGNQLVFVHRDSEQESLASRYKEFDAVTRNDVVPVIPVRMTEAWFLFDSDAICRSAGNPAAAVEVPKPGALENISDPKMALEELLVEASGLSGRRLKVFRRGLVERRVDVASRITSFDPLDAVPSFREFRAALESAYPYGISD